MIIGLTILLSIISIWSFVSLCLLLDNCEDNIIPSFKCDEWYIILSKIYWLVITTTVILSAVIAICYGISQSIVCTIKNNDYKGCPVEKVK